MQWVVIYESLDMFECQLMETLLVDNEIPVQRFSNVDSMYNNFGSHKLHVPEEYVELAKNLLNN